MKFENSRGSIDKISGKAKPVMRAPTLAELHEILLWLGWRLA
jgi:hypothetical protein